jgi:NAD(P)-dependent dehydrogenase (short-subunit alcohol dehydrogenase family)
MGALDGKVAIVTGASRGIGEAIARQFATDGAAVAVVARTQEQTDERLPGTIHETVEAIRAAGGDAFAVHADLSKPEDRARVVETTVAELGPIDILVNNAAVTFYAPFEDFAEKRFRLMFEVQVRAPFELAQLVVGPMRAKKQGWILNISSGAGRHPQGPPYRFPGRGGTVYGMCKAALERFSTGLAAELYDDGVAVNALSPQGVVVTPGVMLHQLIPKGMEDRAEPMELIVAASVALCSGDPKVLTGRITYARDFCEEQGLVPDVLASWPGNQRRS